MRPSEELVRRLFVAAVLVWALLLPLATFAAAGGAGAQMGYGLAGAIYAFGGLICHQRPERSFELWGAHMPVCARCAGIYLGAAAALLAVAAGRSRVSSRPSPATSRLVLVAAALPAGLTLVFEWTTGVAPGNVVRALSGALIGGAVAWLILRSVDREIMR